LPPSYYYWKTKPIFKLITSQDFSIPNKCKAYIFTPKFALIRKIFFFASL